MEEGTTALAMLEGETRALLERVSRLRPFALQVPMVYAAGPSFEAQVAIEQHLRRGWRELKARIRALLAWLRGPAGRAATPAEAQRRFVGLRLSFNSTLGHLDIFSEAMSQRSESGTGVWLAGLDEVAGDALRLPGFFEPPPVLCYLARGPGAAIRRAHTRLPGGGDNPVAIIRLPRERMIGAGIASSLAHEVGHQGAALLDLVTSLRAEIAARGREAAHRAPPQEVWSRWSRWISEIVADFWAVARVGVAATTGLIAVVSLPRAFIVRDNRDDPHPTPWLRVKLSCAIGDALYPHRQWRRLAAQWDELYPLDGVRAETRRWLAEAEAGIPALVSLLLGHRPAALRGHTLGGALASPERGPERLAALWTDWRARPREMRAAAPALAFAVVGQARADGALAPEDEGPLLAGLLEHHAMRATLDRAAVCAAPRAAAAPLAPAPAAPAFAALPHPMVADAAR